MRMQFPLAILMALLVGACSGEQDTADDGAGPMESAGKKIDEMGEKTAEKMDEMGDTMSAAMSDAYLHAKARGKLLDIVGTDALRIEIDVEGKKVTLRGDVRELATVELAKKTVARLEGVESVDSELMHKPPSSDDPDVMDKAGKELSDAVIATKARMALLDELGSDGLSVNIDVADGAVVLSGTVTSGAKAEAAAEAVRGIDNVKRVENELESGS